MEKKTIMLFLVFCLLLGAIYGTGKKEVACTKKAITVQRPQKIVSLSVASDEILLSLVDKKRIAALTYLSTNPNISNVCKQALEVKEHVGMDVEKIITLQPDLVITSTFTPQEAINQMKSAGIAVYSFQLSTNMAEIKKNILDIARAVDEEKRGKDLVKQMEEEEKRIKEKITLPKNSHVLYYSSITGTQGKGTQFDELANILGMKNIVAEAGLVGPVALNKEKIIDMNPDIIILANWSFAGQEQEILGEWQKDPSLASLRALKEKRVYVLSDRHFSCYSQYIMLGLEDLARTIYPEEFD